MSSASAAAHLADDEPVGPHAQARRARAPRTLTPPAPSALAGRASSRTTCGCARRSSAVSSMVTMRSPGGIACGQRVEQRGLARARAAGDEHVPARADGPVEERGGRGIETERRRAAPPRAPKRRMVTHGPSTASGGITACRREPSGSRASTIGDARSSRRPSGRDDPLDEADDRGGVEVERRPARADRRARRTRGPAR